MIFLCVGRRFCYNCCMTQASTSGATGVTSSSAYLNGDIQNSSGTLTFQFEYGTDETYGTVAPIPAGDPDNGIYVQVTTGLDDNTTYHFQLLAYDDNGTTYGGDQIFTTNDTGGDAPSTTSVQGQSVTAGGATLFGYVNPGGNDTTYYFEYGTDTTYGTETSSIDAGSGSDWLNEYAIITGLSPSTTYHFQVVATNINGTTYGGDVTFVTNPSDQDPAVTTTAASDITSSSATLNGTINPDGDDTTYGFSYGLTPAYGHSVPDGTPADAGSGTSDVDVSQNATGLSSGTTYYYELIASNDEGETHGGTLSFTTS